MICLTYCVGWGTMTNEKLLTFCEKVKAVGVNNLVLGSLCKDEQQVPTY